MDKRGYFFIGFTTIVFSTIEILIKFLDGEFAPLQLIFLRFFFGLILLLPFAIRKIYHENYRLNFKDILNFAFLGFLAIPVSMVLYQYALVYTHASVVALLISSNPVIVAPFATLILKEKFTYHTLIALILGLIGIIAIANPFHLSENISLPGLLLGIGASITFGLYGVLGKKATNKYGGLIMNTFSFGFGLCFLSIYMLQHQIPFFNAISATNLWKVLYLGIVTTGLGYITYFKGMELTSATQGSIVFFIKPALASFLAVMLLAEPFKSNMLIGTILIISGSLFMFHKPKSKEPLVKNCMQQH